MQDDIVFLLPARREQLKDLFAATSD